MAIGGADAASFLQGLITIDIERITPALSAWGALLTPQGRWLHDFFVIKDPDNEGFLLDCEHARSDDLKQRLLRYRLRANVDIALCPDRYAVAVAFGESLSYDTFQLTPQEGHTHHKDGSIFYVDPRAAVGGVRILVDATRALDALALSTDPEPYTQWRIRHVLPQGTPDFIPERSLLLDNNADTLHGIDWHKGCYIGQEVTARMYHRGKKKRTLCCVPMVAPATPPPYPCPMKHNNETIGEIRLVSGGYGLANVTLPFNTKLTWHFDDSLQAFVAQP
ncbi:MAG: folate-binding protein YgfZ [Alphaproteobacteria bacterium GM202ARS2]|nr:folate-binding protein YgfZ [Alphaproteobacteria bacterium GM202ARS2]